MVKFKSRYFLIEILYEGKRINNFDTAKIAHILKEEVVNLFGEIGEGEISTNFQVKYLNDCSNLLIIRIGKDYYKIIQSALCLLNNIDGRQVRLRTIGISGTIKKMEKRALKYLRTFNENYRLKGNK